MKFDRARESIDALEASGDVTILDALNVFYDLCEDIRDSKAGAVDKLPPGDEDRMAGRLCWAGRLLLRIAKSNAEAVAGTDKAGRLEKICQELKSQDDVLTEVEQQVKTLIKKQEILEERKQAMEAALKQEKALSQSCGLMEREIAEYESLKAPGLKERHEQLTDRLAQCRKDTEVQEQKLAALQESLTAAISEETEAAEHVTGVQEKLAEVSAHINQLKLEDASLNLRLQNMTKEHRQLVETIRSLEDRLNCTRLEDLRAELAGKQAEADEQELACSQLEEQIKAGEERLYRLRQDWSSKNKYTQELAWEEENELKKAEAELKELQKRIEDAGRRRQCLTEAKEQQAEELSELEDWFDSLEVRKYKDRMDACAQRIRVLKSARNGLLEELSDIMAISSDNVRENLTKYQKYYRDTIDDIEKSLEKYQESYRLVIRIYDNGGSLL